MTLLLKNGTIVNPDSEAKADVLIENNKIIKVAQNIEFGEDATVVDLKGKLIFPGFIDMHVHLREPGEEKKETIATGLSAAVHGGITAVCAMPNTKPVIDNEFLVKFLKDKAWEINKARIYPIGTITKGIEGKSLSEMGAMFRTGAVAFSDDGFPVDDMLVLRRALQYMQTYNCPLILHCEDRSLSNYGAMNEGEISTKIGVPAIHSSSEEVGIASSIEVAKYFGPIHICHVSTKESVEIIRFAKKRGIKVTAETCPHYFTLTELAVGEYDTNAKMNPPLRTEADRKAIIEGLRDGTIDVIATDHAPHTIDDKNQEFNSAAFGIIGLETALMLTFRVLVQEEGFSLSEIAKFWSTNPSEIISVNSGKILPGKLADLTVIDPTASWKISESFFVSKSKNSPFIGYSGKGKAVMTIVNGDIRWSEKK